MSHKHDDKQRVLQHSKGHLCKCLKGASTKLPRFVASCSWWFVITLWDLAVCLPLMLVRRQTVWISNSKADRIMLEVSEAACRSACPCLNHITNTDYIVRASAHGSLPRFIWQDSHAHLMFSARLLSATTCTLLLQILKGHVGWL